jgi:four helix bundle protein
VVQREESLRAFRELKVWQKGHQLTLAVHRATQAFPRDELYGLTSQLRRASASIPANIAEGCVRGSGAEFRRFLQVALGSASEVEYHVLLASELGFLSSPQYESLQREVIEIKRMLTSFIQRLQAES